MTAFRRKILHLMIRCATGSSLAAPLITLNRQAAARHCRLYRSAGSECEELRVLAQSSPPGMQWLMGRKVLRQAKCVRPQIYINICLSIHLSMHLSMRRLIYLSIYRTYSSYIVQPAVYSIYLIDLSCSSVYLSGLSFSSIPPSINRSIRLSISVHTCCA